MPQGKNSTALSALQLFLDMWKYMPKLYVRSATLLVPCKNKEKSLICYENTLEHDKGTQCRPMEQIPKDRTTKIYSFTRQFLPFKQTFCLLLICVSFIAQPQKKMHTIKVQSNNLKVQYSFVPNVKQLV